MSLAAKQVAELEKPLNAKHVAQRKQSGVTLSYIEGWHAIAEANRIFGFDGWTRETVEMREVRPAERVKSSSGKETWRVGFICRVRVTVGDIVREGTGYGSGALPDLGEAYESAVKEAETDAMKRALMTFGNPFGLALYDKERANVERDEPERRGRTDDGNPFAGPDPTHGTDADPEKFVKDGNEAVRLLSKAKTMDDLATLWRTPWIQSTYQQAPKEIADRLLKTKDDRKAELAPPSEGTDGRAAA